MPPQLYHFTSEFHWLMIQRAGFLKKTESNIGAPVDLFKPFGEHVGPDVVWLTETKEPSNNGLVGGVFNKEEVRFTIPIHLLDVNKLIRWRDFATQHGIDPRWYRALDKSGGYTARYWWVYLDEIPIASERILIDLLPSPKP